MALAIIFAVFVLITALCGYIFGRITREPKSWYADEVERAKAICDEIAEVQKTHGF